MERYNHIKDVPTTLYVIVFGFGIWGAILNYFRREDDGIQRTIYQKIGNFFLDMISSMGLSVLSFLSLIGLGFNEIVAVAFSGWIAHQGTRAVYLIELLIAEKVGSKNLQEEADNKFKKEK